MNLSVCCPSLHKPVVKTAEIVPGLRVYVAPEEAAAYRQGSPGVEVLECAAGVQGNLCRVLNHILDREREAGAEAIVILDDDLEGIYRWSRGERRKLGVEEVRPWMEACSELAREWGAKMWGVQVNADKQSYSEMRPFSTVNYVGGPLRGLLADGVCRYDERLFLKDDHDMCLQQLNRYRTVLRFNMYFYVADQSTAVGGCAGQRSVEVEYEQVRLLQAKWGSHIVKWDTNASRSHSMSKHRRAFADYNPVWRVPIKGV